MKKFGIISLICCFVFVAVGNAETDITREVERRWSLGLSLGRYNPSEKEMSRAKSTIIGASLECRLNEFAYIGVDVSSVKLDLSSKDVFGNDVVTGKDMNSKSIIFRARVGKHVYWKDEHFFPYVMGGVGYSFNDWSGTQETNDAGTRFGVDDEIVYKAGIGWEVFFHETFTGYFEGVQVWQKPTATYAPAGASYTTEIDLSASVFLIGFRMKI